LPLPEITLDVHPTLVTVSTMISHTSLYLCIFPRWVYYCASFENSELR